MAWTLNRLLESNLSELLEAKRAVTPENPLRFYLEVLGAYLKGDIESLKQIAMVKPNAIAPDAFAATLRLQIRLRSIDLTFHAQVIQFAEQTENLSWRGELYFVSAMAFEISGDDRQAQHYYKISSEIFELAGCHKKSIKAFSNYVAAETRIFPEKKLIVEYDYVYRKAKQLKEFGVAGMALNNISREYQRAGAFHIALKFVSRALVFLRHDFGSLHYYLAVVHRAHVLFDLKRTREAFLDIEEASHSNFSEIKEAVNVLKKIYSNPKAEKNKISSEHLTFTWRERFSDGPTEVSISQLGGMEEKLVHYLTTGCFSKFEIIEQLYGKDIDFESAENRFKNLIGRIRKKHPGLIAFSEGKYKIADISFLPTEYFKVG